MATLYFSRLGSKIFKLNKIPLGQTIVEHGAPLSIEYKNFRIKSKKFDFIGDSEIAIINNIRTKVTKEPSPENIVYYDKKANPKDNILDIEVFDPSEYGNSLCYYTRSYQGTNISICTKFYEIDERFGILSGISDLLHLGGKIPRYGLYFSLTGTFIDGVDKILDRLTYKRELLPEHTVEFSCKNLDRPLYYGSYICFPEIKQQDLNNVLDNYVLDDNTLVHNISGEIYKDSYYVLELNNIDDPTLYDYDFSNDTNELLHKLDSHDKNSLQKFVQINSDAQNFSIIKTLIAKLSDPTSDKLILLSLYNKLTPTHKNWLNDNFPQILTALNR